MKRLLRILPALLLAAALLTAALLLGGCGLLDPDPADSIPDGSYFYGDSEASGNGNEESIFSGGDRKVKTVLNYSGEIPLTEPRRSYSYQLPMIDLGGAQAVGINNELEDRFGLLIRQSLEAMERYEEPILERLSYSSFTRNGILTLRVDRRDYDGGSFTAYYTVDAEDGSAVSVKELFNTVGLQGSPSAILSEEVTERFVQRYGSPEGADAAHTTALTRTLAALEPLTANRMHLSEDGRLIVAFELFAPDGGSSIVELTLP